MHQPEFVRVVALPVERRLPALGAHRRPALGEPKLRAVVAVLLNERKVLSAGNQARREPVRWKINTMARRLVVEGERVDRSRVESKSDLDQAGRKINPVHWRRDHLAPLLRSGGGLKIRRMQRIGEERMLDVGGDQFLMLLFVLEAQRDAPRSFILQRMLHQDNHCGVDVRAIAQNDIQRRPRERGAQFLLRHFAQRVVVAVEEPVKFRVEGLVPGNELTQDEGLEEPAGVGEMPLHRTRLCAGLHHHVFRRQRTTKTQARLADGLVAS